MTSKNILIAVILLIIGIGFIFFGQTKNDFVLVDSQPTQNVRIKDGVQYITINARGGYSPKISVAQAGMPTKLIIKTDNTYDCSLSLVIRSINYRKILSSTGEEIIDLDKPQAGALRGLCSMGMYNFIINFN